MTAPSRVKPKIRLILGAVVALATLVSTIGSEPALPDRPVAASGLDVGAPHWSSEPSEATLGQLANQPSQHSEQFYFALPDRFANGDPANDHGGLTGDRMSTGYDPTDKGFYHGGDIKGVIDRLDYIQNLGTTAIWLAPVFKNRTVQGTGANASAGYHGYWITDFSQVDPHFGTDQDLKDLVRLAHRRGIKIYLDVIVNHTADVIANTQGQFSYRGKADYPYRDANGQPFDDSNYADSTRGFPAVNLRSFPYTPAFANAADATVKRPDWLNDPTMYHNRGDSTFVGENAEYGDFFGLDDLWTERPDVVRGMTRIYQDWITRAGVDGYRIDTVKHVDLPFWPQFSSGVQGYASAHGKPDFFMFGEVFNTDPDFDSTYVRRGGLPATLDFPFQAAASGYVARGGSATDLANVYASDDLYTARTTDARQLPTFLGNHDMGRIGYFVTTGGTDPATYLRRDVLGHELMFLTRGQPVVYSGDEQGFTGRGGDKDARQDMFASQTPDYLTDPVLGTSRTHAADQYDQTHPVYQAIARLAALRNANPALKDGIQVIRYAANGPGVFAFSRVDPKQQVEYLVAVNNATTSQSVPVPTYSAGMTFEQLYPSAGPLLQTAADTTLSVTVPPLSAVVFKARRPLAKPTGAPSISIVKPGAGETVATRTEVVADLAGGGSNTGNLSSVTFAVRVGGGDWQLLGRADHAPYRVFHDLDGLAAGTTLEYKAVVRDAAGHTASAKTTATVGTPRQTPDRDYLVVHYQRPAGDYDNRGLYVWGDVDPSAQTTWPAGQPFAGEDSYGRFAWVKLKPGARSVGFIVVDSNGVKDVAVDRFADPSRSGEIWLRQGDPAVSTSEAAATGSVSVHYGRPDGQYAGWGLHLWGDGLAPGTGTDWTNPRQPDGVDSYGAYWRVPVGDVTKPVNFIVHNGDNKDPGPDQSVVPAAQGEAWIRSGEAVVHPNRAAAEHTAVLHYREPDGDYTGWGLHVWTGAANPTDWTSPLPPAAIDNYGAVFRVPLVDGATALSYIVHKGDTKDLPADQSLDLVGVGHEAWLLAGQPRYLLPQPEEAAPDLDITKAKAQWIDRSTLAWHTGPTDGKRYDLVYDAGGGLTIVDGELSRSGQTLGLHARPDGLTEAQRAKFPNLWQYSAFRVDAADLARVPDALRGQLVATERDAAGKLLSATAVQIPGVLDDMYPAATGARLGPTFDHGRPTLAVWAPTAQSVALELAGTPAGTPAVIAMSRDEATGVWRATGDRSWIGRYYRYRVTAWQPAAHQVVTASVTDPYSVSLSTDSTFSQLTDLADPSLAPPGWANLHKPAAPSRAQIQELSVRDFSIADTTVPAGHRGTYLAFTDADSAGVKHLRELAAAGDSYVHLLPAFDFASTPERRADQAVPNCDLPSLPPDSEAQQACIAAVANSDGYNWGYDPYHYTTPEGSYATDPEGSTRTVQFRQMVAGINGAGLRVVMDVVYNHTPAAGTDRFSVLDQIVPGYYQRLLDDGSLATSTCCANTAPEHAMMGKLVVDSIVTWAKQYKVDGFRFDLMGHHPKANILAVRAALDRLTVAHDGVDGRKIVLYGEGWNFGEVADNARFVQATQANMAGTGVGTFNDRLRDAVRGGGPFDGDPRLQGFASGLFTDPNGDTANGTSDQQRARLLHDQDLIKIGLAGNLAGYRFVDSSGHQVTGSQVDYNGSPAGYTGSPGEAVTYVDAHDNEILYDALAYKLPATTPATDRARMQVLALSTTAFGQGIGFVTAGSDRLRSKSLDRNSYNSGDWFNQIRWDCHTGNGFGAGLPPRPDNGDKWQYAKPLLADPALVPDCSTVDLAANRFAELLRIRASSPLFSLATGADVQARLSFPLSGAAEMPGVVTMVLTDMPGHRLDKRWKSITVVFNATPGVVTQTVAALGGAAIALHPVLASSVDPLMRQSSFDRDTGTFTVPARTVAVFVQS